MEKLIRVIRLHPGESVLIVAPEDTPTPPAAVLLTAELPMPDKLPEDIAMLLQVNGCLHRHGAGCGSPDASGGGVAGSLSGLY